MKIYGVGWKPILVSKGPNKTSFAMKSESVARLKNISSLEKCKNALIT